ncbi:lysis system i-spanin subunit Rz [Xenorhabdus ehlersii]|uniref:Bacteriophage Rz lysis protein n=1 Tax=Xenorhabdus ehlersii TaxID=290111 RepID=A0A2D0ILA9_9GAMM|nr:lysis system i-spanin subunit Rz [Xenorhabdus ehlersii]PHM22579.1 peptidase [Xenorhabdus ehlersii]RKE91453.1 bacteriophage Rz lysis protein [Xenorhabdus ehlersii]
MSNVSNLEDAYNWSVAKIAEAFGLNCGTVRKRLLETNVPIANTVRGNPVYALRNNGRLSGENEALTTKLSEKNAIITTQQERIQRLAELDKTHTQELVHAKAEIDTLQADVAAGRRKLRIKAVCPSVSETVTAGGVVDGTPSNSLEKLDQLFSIFEKASSTTGQN